jgi:serine/threonine protein kinase
MRSALATEVNILRSLVSEHTVALYDVRESTNNYYIIMELCDSDLGKIIKQGKQLPEEDCIIILTQIC